MTLLRSMLRVAAAGVLLAATHALAQTSGAVPPAPKPPEQNAPQHFDSQGGKDKDQTLTERLDRTDGVIKPPAHVDRDMLQSPPPGGDSEMVIKPPSTSGGPARPQQ
jgi:hypothetical protein